MEKKSYMYMMSDLLEPQEIKPMFEGCGTSFYLPDSYCRERDTQTDRQTCVGVHSVPFRSHSHLMSAGVLIYNSVSSMLPTEQQHPACQNNLIHPV